MLYIHILTYYDTYIEAVESNVVCERVGESECEHRKHRIIRSVQRSDRSRRPFEFRLSGRLPGGDIAFFFINVINIHKYILFNYQIFCYTYILTCCRCGLRRQV